MSDWMDDLRDSLIEQKRQKEEDAENKRREESRVRSMLGLIFQELEKNIQGDVHRLNQKVYDGQRMVEFRYINNTITGDHFLITLRHFRFYVRVNSKELKIECNLEYLLPQRHDFVPVNGGSEDFFVTTDESGSSVVLTRTNKKESVAIGQISQISEKILSTIVRVAETGVVT